MRWTQPTLVTLEGEMIDETELMGAEEYAELLGIDYEDAVMLGGCSRLSGQQIAYLDSKYPEYMGIWPIIAKFGALIVKGVGAGIKGISKAVKKKKAQKAAASQAAKENAMIAQLKAQALLQQQQAQQAQIIASQKQEQIKKMIMIGVPVAGVALLAIMMMNKKPPEKAGVK